MGDHLGAVDSFKIDPKESASTAMASSQPMVRLGCRTATLTTQDHTFYTVYYLQPEFVAAFPDIRLVSSEGKNYGLNRAVLASVSPLFRSVLEDDPEETDVIIRTEIAQPQLEAFYHFITSGVVPMSHLDTDTIDTFSHLGVDLNTFKFSKLQVLERLSAMVKLEPDDTQHTLMNKIDTTSEQISEEENKPLRSCIPPARSKRRKKEIAFDAGPSDCTFDDLPSDFKEEIDAVEEITVDVNINDFDTFCEEELLKDLDEDENDKEAKKVSRKRRRHLLKSDKRAQHPNLFHFPQSGTRDKSKFQCDQCVRGFGARDSLLQHKYRHTAKGPHEAWTCLLCQEKFEYYRDMIKHKDETHADDPLVCPHCCTKFKFRKSLMNHIKVHDQAVNWVACVNCGKQFARRAELKIHMKKKGKYHTDHCTWSTLCPGIKFQTYQEHLEHVRVVHEGKFAFRCPYCPKVLESETMRRRHMKQNHTITSKEETNHRGEKVVCHECGANVFRCYLTKHLQTVHGDKTFQCTQLNCASVFKCENTLKRHVKDMHTIVPCEACGKVLPMRSYQRHFLRMHTPEDQKPYRCDICIPVRGFITTQDLKEHQNTHTQERPHVCHLCSAAFRSTGNLFAHIRGTHKGIKRVKK